MFGTKLKRLAVPIKFLFRNLNTDTICKEICKKLLVLAKSCWSLAEGQALVSNTVEAHFDIAINHHLGDNVAMKM